MTFLTFAVFDIATFRQTARSFGADLILLDNPSGLQAQHQPRIYPAQGWTVTVITKTRAELAALRTLLDSLKGKWKPFWLPTWTNDIRVVGNGTTTAIQARAFSYEAYNDNPGIPKARRRYLAAWDGATLYPRTINTITRSGDEETVTLTSALPADPNPGVFDLICFLNFVRLAHDEIEIVHEQDGIARCQFHAVSIRADFATES